MKNKLLILLILILIPLNSFAIVSKSEKEYVTDSANILTNDTEDYIVTYSKFIKKVENIDYYVVTLDSLENITLEEYTNYIFNSFHLNKKSLLILVSKNDRNIRIQTGPSLSKIITTETINKYISSYFTPYLKDDNWDEGIKNGYSAFYKLLCNYYKIDSSSMIVYQDDNILSKYKYIIFLIILWICTFISRKTANYIGNMKKENPSTTKDFLLVLSIILNIYLLILEYFIIPIGVIIILGFEIVNLLPLISSNKSKKKKHK